MKRKVYLAQFSIIVENQFVLLPYSVASIWAFARSFDEVNNNYELAGDFLFIKKPIEEVIESIVDPDIFGLSVYVWNSNYSDELAKKVKEKYPKCLIMYGGPQVPDSDEEFFKKKPWVDIAVHQEGEFSFRDILLSNLKDKNWDSISGISYNKSGSRVKTSQSVRIKDLSSLPSPYLSGLFDGYVEKYSNFTLNAILETNRGCPYKCTFCDWGGVNFSKLEKFEEERVNKEIDWMGKNKIDCIVNADANFGILKSRDSAIVDELIQTKQKYGYPNLFTTNWAKNNNELMIEMAARLKKAGLLRKFAIALQSLNKETLSHIERTNMKLNDFENLVSIAKRHDITVMIELIMNLPGETYESWIKNYCELLKYDNLYIESYPLSVLANSEMNKPAYREKFGLKTTRVKLPFGEVIDEHEQMIVETNSMNFEEASKAWIFTWMVRSFHSLGFLYYVANFIVKSYGITHYEFYKKIEGNLKVSDTLFRKVYDKQLSYIADKDFVKFYHSNWWAESVGNTDRETFYTEMLQIVKKSYPHPFLNDLFEYQNVASFNPKMIYPLTRKFGYDFINDAEREVEILFGHEGTGNHPTYKSFISLGRSAVWKASAQIKN